MGDKIDPADKTRIEEAVTKMEEALKGDDAEAISGAREEHDKIWSEVSQKLYQTEAENPAPEAGAAEAGTEGSDDANVEDADYTIVDEEEKKETS